MFNCKFCDYRTKKVSEHLLHQKCHLTINKQVHCGYNGCQYSLISEGALRQHLLRHHKISKGISDKRAQCVSKENNTCNADALFQCQIETCRQHFYNYAVYIRHLKNHIKEGCAIRCPVKLCNSITDYSKESSFASHLSKCHRSAVDQPTIEATSNIIELNSSNQCEENSEIDVLLNSVDFVTAKNKLPEYELGTTIANNDTNNTEANSRVKNDILLKTNEEAETNFLNNFANFLLRLETTYTIPISTIQFIMDELQSMAQYNQDITNSKIKAHLLEMGLCNEQIEVIVQDIATSNPFISSCSQFSTDYKRKKHFRNNHLYVKPQQISISDTDGKQTFFHYVPIVETFKCAFFNKSLGNWTINDAQHDEDPDILSDFTDGSAFRNNEFFKQNPKARKIILYQDGVSVVNPLGSAKSKFKILAVYIQFGDLPPHVRSRMSNIQLVALCKEEWFNADKVFGTIIKDLKILETSGVEIEQGVIEKAGLVYIAGDNLGSHALGGFACNFGRGEYICRYCCATRKQMSECTDDCKGCTNNSKHHTYKIYKKKSQRLRTVESYDKCVRKIQQGKKIVQGITSKCLFNELMSFHACAPGLPPCLGHDIFEGIAPYDLLLFIKYFVKQKWFTWDQLNGRIDTFQYSTQDKKDKPIEIDPSKKRVVGQASQIWTLIRLFPLIINDKIKNPKDPVWEALLVLCEIIDIVCSPKLRKSYVPYVDKTINKYLVARSRLFPRIKLRPKHHYVQHYAELASIFGPLILVWTMRFESKHPFFKNVVRKVTNFINVTWTMSDKHELYQSLIRKEPEMKHNSVIKHLSPFLHLSYSPALINAIDAMNIAGGIKECTSVNIIGTEYKRGDVVVLHQDDYQLNVQLGRIVLILVSDDESIHLVANSLNTEFQAHLRLYRVNETENYVCVDIKNLYSYQSLHMYTVGTHHYVRLHHAILH